MVRKNEALILENVDGPFRMNLKHLKIGYLKCVRFALVG